MSYSSYNSIFAAHPNVDEAARREFTASWLEETYGITVKPESAFLDELSKVHDHDGQPLHFGLTKLPSSLSRIWVRLVKMNGLWMLAATTKEDGSNLTILPAAGLEVPDMITATELLSTVAKLIGQSTTTTGSVFGVPSALTVNRPKATSGRTGKYGILSDEIEDYSKPETVTIQGEDLLFQKTRSIDLIL